ncbi:hypothetical protein F9C07_2283931 [Aspergillus flavus]|uniref:Uncharacterized protein n=4 Tax=Aspergillus subgen. Circumdati TaxID=2720871 RepID=A0A7U2MVN0_ASPFN|nr:uncharacterized protein G4B84_007092 [Aspergillus flavus NRRL3357]KOC11815.1 hypothetical protein AFLA70_790g000181 [Aspergillus flavus AF70]OOO11961.1 hypothetical protein OAory_01084310 [Aspergillus oryzae]QMW43741.1 hypothetical protein G4B11_007111 [Aspergillus flavus]KAF7621409.1 hypothetical protein AFLA_011712 [Aspergillus flavus NRRL3357]QMW31711.1 hypothetical protein G4B84_007092 [Aspergillus flavus NRRL3357]
MTGTNFLVLLYMAMLASAAVISPLVSSAPPLPAAPVLKRAEWIPLDAPMLQGNGSYEKGLLPSSKGGKCGYWDVDGYIAQCDCIMTGSKMADSYIEQYASSACDAFLSSLPGANVVNSKWLRFAVKNLVGTNGKPNVLNFRWKKVSKGELTLTKELCNDAYKMLANTICDKKDAKATRGGTIKFAGDQGIEIGVDPDEMKNFKEKDKRYTNVGKFIDAVIG